jgi:hypothetical protein
MGTRRAIKKEKQSIKTRLFSLKLKSEGNSKNMMIANGVSIKSDVTQGVLGVLSRAYFAEGIIWDVFGASGVLRVDRGEPEITKPELKGEAEAK